MSDDELAALALVELIDWLLDEGYAAEANRLGTALALALGSPNTTMLILIEEEVVW